PRALALRSRRDSCHRPPPYCVDATPVAPTQYFGATPATPASFAARALPATTAPSPRGTRRAVRTIAPRWARCSSRVRRSSHVVAPRCLVAGPARHRARLLVGGPRPDRGASPLRARERPRRRAPRALRRDADRTHLKARRDAAKHPAAGAPPRA